MQYLYFNDFDKTSRFNVYIDIYSLRPCQPSSSQYWNGGWAYSSCVLYSEVYLSIGGIQPRWFACLSYQEEKQDNSVFWILWHSIQICNGVSDFLNINTTAYQNFQISEIYNLMKLNQRQT